MRHSHDHERRPRPTPSRAALMVVQDFPPEGGWSPIRRHAAFARQLVREDWQAVVTAPSLRSTPETVDEATVYRFSGPTVWRRGRLGDMRGSGQFILTAANLPGWRRVLSGVKRILLPEEQLLWIVPAVRAGLEAVRRHPVRVLYSSYPPVSAHLVGHMLAALTGLPWVADFRDPWVLAGRYPGFFPTEIHWRLARSLERRFMHKAAAVITNTQTSAAMHRLEYPAASERITVIRNGFEPADFASSPRRPVGRMLFLHAGAVTTVRTDTADRFLRALGALRGRCPAFETRLEVLFLGSVDDTLPGMARAHGCEAMVRIEAPVAHQECVRRMMEADVLLLLKEVGWNDACIPGKTYEYLAARRPILALTPPSEAAHILQTAGHRVVDPRDEEAVCRAVADLAETHRTGTLALRPNESLIRSFEFPHLAARFVELLAACAQGCGAVEEWVAKDAMSGECGEPT